MAGDGNFRWWWGSGSEPENYSGPFNSRDEAHADAMGDGEPEVYGGFTICEADKSVLRGSIDGDDLAEYVTERLADNNEECWGEDGPNGEAWTNEAMKALAKALEKTVSDWVAQYPAKTWAFGNMRNEEYVSWPESEAQ